MDVEQPDETVEAPWPPLGLVTTADFGSVDYNAAARSVTSVYDHDLETIFVNMAKSYRGDEPACSVYRLLASVCSLHFRLHDKAGPFGPKLVMGNKRSAIPDDWLGAQNETFAELLPDIEHPGLRARLADVVWANDHKKGTAAQIAVQAYCECAEGLHSGRFKARFPGHHTVAIETIDLLDRALQLHTASNKRTAPVPERATELLNQLYARAREHVDVMPAHRLGTLLSRYSLINLGELAADMEAVAVEAEAAAKDEPLVIKELWELAAFAHGQERQTDDERRCQIAAAEQNVKMAQHMGSWSAQAHWYRRAIGEMRRIPGTDRRREELRREMRALQERAQDEVASFSIPLDLTDAATGTIAVFEGMTLPDALKHFALLAKPMGAKEMRDEALDGAKSIVGMFAATYVDEEGKVLAEVEGAPSLGAPSETWIKSKMAHNMSLGLHVVVRGQIDPARRYISDRFQMSERHFRFIVQQSPVVPSSHAATFALGFARMMQGDLLSAGPLLIPQLEHCVRHVLMNGSTDTSKMRSDLTQEDRSLSALLELYRDDMVRLFGEDMTLTIDLLFNHRPGPALRHEFAHGKIGDASYGDPAVYYACCLIYLLVCIPLFPYWAQYVAPSIEAASF